MEDSQYKEGQYQTDNKDVRLESWHSSESQEQCTTAESDPESLSINDEQDLIGRHSTLPEILKRPEHHQEGSPGPETESMIQDPLYQIDKRRFPGITLQPEFSPISQEQLAAEVKL
jgi:hypothetical protein